MSATLEASSHPRLVFAGLDKNSRLVHVMSVCRYWRDLVLGTPILWSPINVGLKPDWLNLCLIRSATCPLDIVFHSNRFPQDQLELLYPHTHRIRSLAFRFLVENWRGSLRSFLDYPMPCLEELNYPRDAYAVGSGRASDQDELDLSSKHLPALRCLTLVGVIAPHDLQTYANLPSLTLRACRCNLTITQFFVALSGSRALTSLSLYNMVDMFPRAGDATSPSESILSTHDPITLPRLTVLFLVERHTEYTAALLERLSLPMLVRLQVEGRSLEYDVRNPPTISNLLPKDAKARPPPVAQTTIAFLQVYNHGYSVFGSITQGDQPDQPNVHLFIETEDEETYRDNNLRFALHDLMEVFSGAPLRCLTVSAEHGTVDSGKWIQALRSFPKLERLCIGGIGQTLVLWEALAAASVPQPPASEPVAPVCPGLRSVRLDGHLPSTVQLLDCIITCLVHRAKLGSRLEALDMVLYHHPSSPHSYEELTDIYLPRLQDLVSEVSYTSRN
ncbi:hypothetical protein C8Q76DRAFT_738272 [Earliella scabrosa]|nr:hypothetical protein C8Q76DRAFT_738272 [Earliella scabrosa]